MKKNINLVKGTHDIYGVEIEKFELISLVFGTYRTKNQ